MQISIYSDGQQSGPFPLDALHNMVRLGSLPDTANVWYEGASDWIPLPAFLQQHPMPAAPMVAAVVQSGVRATISPAPRPAPSRKSGELSDAARLVRGLVAGGVCAILAGAVWAGIAIALTVELGYVAWGIGLATGLAVSKLGRGHGVVFQIIAVVCSLVGIAIGKVGFALSSGFLSMGLFDLLFIVLALASAWQMAGGGKG